MPHPTSSWTQRRGRVVVAVVVEDSHTRVARNVSLAHRTIEMSRDEQLAPSHDSIPTPVAGIDPRTHALTPLQRFVLGHVDGRRSIVDLSTATGVSASTIAALVGRLTFERVMRLLPPRPDDERDSQRPTIPGEAAEMLVHERPTRPMPHSSAPPPRYAVHGGPRSIRRRLRSIDVDE